MTTIEPTNTDKARYIVERTEGCWHEDFYTVQPYVEYNQDRIVACGKCHEPDPPTNPTFLDPAGRIELLELMIGREDWEEFADRSMLIATVDLDNHYTYAVPIYTILDNTGLLLDAAYQFMKEKEI
jgi:hypothetical protein